MLALLRESTTSIHPPGLHNVLRRDEASTEVFQLDAKASRTESLVRSTPIMKPFELVGELHGLKRRCTECGAEGSEFPLFSFAEYAGDEEYWEGPFCGQECVHVFWRAISRLALWVRKTKDIEFKEKADSRPLGFSLVDGNVPPRPIPRNPSKAIAMFKRVKP